MDENSPSFVEKMIQDLTRQRDELKLSLHLGTQEAKEQWDKLEEKLYQLKQRMEPAKEAAEESAGNVWEAVRLLAGEVKEGFDRIRKSIN
jgi:chromosome segregation ATPase